MFSPMTLSTNGADHAAVTSRPITTLMSTSRPRWFGGASGSTTGAGTSCCGEGDAGTAAVMAQLQGWKGLQRRVAVLALRALLALGPQHRQAASDRDPGVCRVDHVVDQAAFGRVVRMHELALVLGD